MNKIEKTNIIIQASLSKIISDDLYLLNDLEIEHMLKYVDFNKIPDRIIADNDFVYHMINWDLVDRMKIIRLVSRNINLTNFIDISIYKYSIEEVKNMLKIHPILIDNLNIDLEKISTKEAFILLTIGIDEISFRIDVESYNFTPKQAYEIIEFNEFSETIMRKVNLNQLKDYHICDIIINTGDKYFDILDLKKLTARKWLEIFQNIPKLVQSCDLNIFKTCDIYNSIELICMFPHEDFDFLIKDRDYQSEISSFGWEKLIINKPNEYIDICCYWKLNETNWKNIIESHPDLIAYKL